MSLFDADEFIVCKKCRGTGLVWDDRVGADKGCPTCGATGSVKRPEEESDGERDG